MRLAFLVSLLLAPSAVASPRPLERIVAVVDRTPITLSEVRARARPLQQKLERDHMVADVPKLEDEVLARMVEEHLVAADADARHIEATTDEVDRAVEAMASQGKTTPDALYAGAAKELGLTREAYRAAVRQQILEAKWESATFGPPKDETARERARAKALATLRTQHHVEVRR